MPCCLPGLLLQTTCRDSLTAADWEPPLWSPKLHHAADVNASLLHRWAAVMPMCIAAVSPLLSDALLHCWVHMFRMRTRSGTQLECDAAVATAKAAAFFRRRGAGTSLAGQWLLPGPQFQEQTHEERVHKLSTSLRKLQHEQQQGSGQILGETCLLFARKFGPHAVQVSWIAGMACAGVPCLAVLALVGSCLADALVLHQSLCRRCYSWRKIASRAPG